MDSIGREVRTQPGEDSEKILALEVVEEKSAIRQEAVEQGGLAKLVGLMDGSRLELRW